MAVPHAPDAVLAEYLRVINHKDGEIYDLLAKVERLEMEAKKKEDKYKARLRELKVALEAFQAQAATEDRAKHADNLELSRIRVERDQIQGDLVTLKASFQRQEEHLQAALKSSAKLARQEGHARERLEAELADQRRTFQDKEQRLLDRVAVLEQQNGSLQQRVLDCESELHKWKKEAKKADELSTELRRRLNDSLPKTETAKLQLEMERLRSETLDLTERLARKESVIAEVKVQNQRADEEIGSLTKRLQEVESIRAREKLQRASQLEQWRGEAENEFRRLEEANKSLETSRLAQQNEIAALQQRLVDADARFANLESQSRHRDDAKDAEMHSLKLRIIDLHENMESLKRTAAQQEALARHFKDRSDATREEAQQEIVKLKDELEQERAQTARQKVAISALEGQLLDARRELSNCQAELTGSRSIETELRRKIAEVEEALRLSRESDASRQLENEIALKNATAQHTMALREAQRDLTIARSDVSSLREQVMALTSRCRQMEADLSSAQSSLSAKVDRERALSMTIREQDDKITKLEVILSEREASISALRRAIDSGSVNHAALQSSVDEITRKLQTNQAANEQLRAELQHTRQLISQRDEEKMEMTRQLTKFESQYSAQAQEMSSQMTVMKDRVRDLLNELQAAEQRLSLERSERARADTKHNEETMACNRNVILPLQEKNEALTAMHQRLQRELQDRDARLGELQRQLNDSMSASKITSEEMRRLQDENTRLRVFERDLFAERETSRRLRADLDTAQGRLAVLEQSVEQLSRDLSDVRAREASASSQLASKKAELSSLMERSGNIESLKSITERQLAESTSRERILLEKLEDAKQAHGILQTCFNQQQEQLEALRRLKDPAVQESAGTRRVASFASSPPRPIV